MNNMNDMNDMNNMNDNDHDNDNDKDNVCGRRTNPLRVCNSLFSVRTC